MESTKSPYRELKTKTKGTSNCLKCRKNFKTYNPIGNRICPKCTKENNNIIFPRSRAIG